MIAVDTVWMNIYFQENEVMALLCGVLQFIAMSEWCNFSYQNPHVAGTYVSRVPYNSIIADGVSLKA